jgi:cytochrome P450
LLRTSHPGRCYNPEKMKFLSAIAVVLTFPILFVILSRVRHLIAYRTAARRRGCSAPPRLPSKDPMFSIDNVLADLRQRKEKRKIKTLYATFQKLGKTFESYPFGRRVIATVDPRNVQFVLATGFEKFGVGPARAMATVPMMGRGIIVTDGKEWREGRDFIMPTFTRSQIADRDMFEKHVQRFLKRLPSDGRTTDLGPLFDQLVSGSMHSSLTLPY